MESSENASCLLVADGVRDSDSDMAYFLLRTRGWTPPAPMADLTFTSSPPCLAALLSCESKYDVFTSLSLCSRPCCCSMSLLVWSLSTQHRCDLPCFPPTDAGLGTFSILLPPASLVFVVGASFLRWDAAGHSSSVGQSSTTL